MANLSDLWSLRPETFDALLAGRTPPGAGPPPAEWDELPLLGDALIPAPRLSVTHSTEIDQPAVEVWRWVAQLMRGAGTYGWPALELGGAASSPTLIEGLPPPAIGDRAANVLYVAAVDPGREVVWSACGSIELVGHSLDGLTLDYRVQPVRGKRAVLIARMRGRLAGLGPLLAGHLFNLVDQLLPACQVRRIRQVAEAAARARKQGVA
jgi:hypothetical protein